MLIAGRPLCSHRDRRELQAQPLADGTKVAVDAAIARWDKVDVDPAESLWPDPLPGLPRLTPQSLLLAENEAYFNGRRAFILEGVAREWPALTEWTDEWIVSKLGEQ